MALNKVCSFLSIERLGNESPVPKCCNSIGFPPQGIHCCSIFIFPGFFFIFLPVFLPVVSHYCVEKCEALKALSIMLSVVSFCCSALWQLSVSGPDLYLFVYISDI